MLFSNRLIKWYLQNKRDLPWRNTNNPYFIWLSEIILQQTRVAQGLPYYLKFIEAFPTINDLANTPEEEVLKLWQGLGYYSRARNLHAAAKHIAFELNGNFPNNYNDLLKLKGVGEYTAAAIASISHNEDVAVVDGNVFRVLARYFGIENDISQPKTKNEFQKLANELLPKGKAANFNQALMEFGAIQCTPKNPDCENCIFSTSCFALQHKKVAELPVKLKRTKITNRYLNYLIIIDNENNTIIEKRTENGIWKNLYQFPLIETLKNENPKVIILEIEKQYNPSEITLLTDKPLLHKLSHQHLHIRFFEVKTSYKQPDAISFSEAFLKPFPIVIHNFLEINYLTLTKKQYI